ncbi:MAG: adenylosuccinate synthetase [Leptospirales bacterium]|nr:adenylosuccinate synthetase [Leptospirales bacterium]
MSPNVRHILVCGLGFGDEGKGSVTDFLVRKFDAELVVRYNGGPQAAHNVVAPIGRTGKAIHHCFAQFGAGTLAGADTYLSEFMAVDPLALMAEARVLTQKGINPFDKLIIDEECILVTPFHQLMNRLRELLRGSQRHGSCGMGVGEAILDMERSRPGVRLRDLMSPGIVTKLQELQDFKIDEASKLLATTDLKEPQAVINGKTDRVEMDSRHQSATAAEIVADLENPALLRIFLERLVPFLESIRIGNRNDLIDMLRKKRSIFEGAQGVLLDRDAGFFPYVTPSRTTFANALEILKHNSDEFLRLGVLRGYMTRHGAGPLVSEIDTPSSQDLKDEHNHDGPWQGALRVGWFDAVAGRYALSVSEVDGLAISNIDRLPRDARICRAYRVPSGKISNLPLGDSGKKPGKSELTQLVFEAAPIFAPLDPVRAAEQISEELNRKLLLISNGPGPENKTWL